MINVCRTHQVDKKIYMKRTNVTRAYRVGIFTATRKYTRHTDTLVRYRSAIRVGQICMKSLRGTIRSTRNNPQLRSTSVICKCALCKPRYTVDLTELSPATTGCDSLPSVIRRLSVSTGRVL